MRISDWSSDVCSSDLVDVVVTFKERSAGQFVFGLGFSQLAGLTFSVAVSQDNFLSTGNSVSVSAATNTFSKYITFGVTDPYFTDDGVSVGYNVRFSDFKSNDANTANFNSTQAAALATFGIPLSETDGFSTAFGIDSNQIFTARGFTPDSLVDRSEEHTSELQSLMRISYA